jgi:hypothetical protein
MEKKLRSVEELPQEETLKILELRARADQPETEGPTEEATAGERDIPFEAADQAKGAA